MNAAKFFYIFIALKRKEGKILTAASRSLASSFPINRGGIDQNITEFDEGIAKTCILCAYRKPCTIIS